MARPAGQARPDPTEAARESLTGPDVGVARELAVPRCSFPECVIDPVVEIIHSQEVAGSSPASSIYLLLRRIGLRATPRASDRTLPIAWPTESQSA
jgi:hypothetical protein